MRRVAVPIWVIIAIVAVIAAGCGAVVAMAAQSYSGPSPGDARKAAVENRADNFNRASNLYKDPHNTNFPLRKALLEMNNREDLVNHPWYIYILGDNGNTIGYYVAKTVPVNACDFISSTEDVWKDDHGNLKMQSPSYDGIYYGNTLCNVYVFFDQTTNAMIEVGGSKFYVADQPLRIEAQAIKVKRG